MDNKDENQKQNNQSPLYEERRVYGTEKQLRERNSVGKRKYEENRTGRGTQLLAICVLLLFVVLFIAVGISIIKPSDSKDKHPVTSVTRTPDKTSEADAIVEEIPVNSEYYCVVLSVDKREQLIYGWNVETGSEITLPYDGTGKFYAEMGSLVTPGSIAPGALLHITMKTGDDPKVLTAEWDSKMWTGTNVTDLTVSSEKHELFFRDNTYSYNGELCVMYNGQRISWENRPEGYKKYTVRGIGQKAYEVIITTVLPTMSPVPTNTPRPTATPTIKPGETPAPTPTKAATIPADIKFNEYSIDGPEWGLELDLGHRVYIYYTEDIGDNFLYVNGAYTGALPASFDKVVGTTEIWIFYKGAMYVFSYEEYNDSGNIYIKFPDDFTERKG